ncbi:MAG: serpin family protein [Chloroflexi bacterium]|nr:serpin family protein [Chloroflexota bacterium]
MPLRRLAILALAGPIAVGGCAGPSPYASNDASPAAVATQSPTRAPSAFPSPTAPEIPGVVLLAGAPRDTSAVAEGDVSAVTAADIDFGLDLLRQLDGERNEPNLAISPTSIATVLSMIVAGARGRTAGEMIDVLHAPFEGDRLHRARNGYDRIIRERFATEGVDLALANQLFGQPGTCTPTFVDTMSREYGAPLATVDFTDPEPARALINRWVADHTGRRIEELMPKGSIDESTVLVLANAMHLDAAWRYELDPELTHQAPFELRDGTSVQVPTMHYDWSLPLAQGDGWTALELPYSGDQTSMVLLDADLDTFLRKLDARRLREIFGKLAMSGIHASFPRFSMTVHSSLRKPLEALGMRTVFQPASADLGPMGCGKHVGVIEHEAFIEVDEKGTEAAAATGAMIPGSHGPTVAFARPFLFFVRDRATDAVLFMGRVDDPRELASD